MAGQLHSTGWNTNGQLGLGDTAQRTSLVQIGALDTWVAPRVNPVGKTVLCVRDGQLWGWGENGSLRLLGLGNTTAYFSTPQQIGSADDWQTAVNGETFGLGLRVNGDLYAWGSNSSGQHGTGDTATKDTPQKVGTYAWNAIAAGSSHSLAIRSDGSLWAAGSNGSGQLGLGDTSGRTSWTRVGAESNWVAIAAAGTNSYGIKADGTLWAWGANSRGQLGLGDTTQRTSPVQVGTGTNWRSISAGTAFAVAIQQDGTLWSWGKGDDGCTGHGDTTQRTSPAQVGTAVDWYAVSAGNSHAMAVKDDGTLWAWGYNGFGGLGLGDTTGRTTPTQVGTATIWNVPAVGTWFSVVSTGPHAAADTCQPEAPIVITVSATTCQPEAPIRIDVSGLTQPEAPIAIAVTDGLTRTWGLRVLLDGVVQSQTIYQCKVLAEEGAARIASLSMRAPDGPVNPVSYTGRHVQIDLLRAGVPLRLFTGRVDLPSYDPYTRTLGLSCTDDLQNRVAALSREQIDALTGGGYHRAVHGEIDDNWDYAQACMLTQQASLDAGPYGELRVTPWFGLASWHTFGHLDGGPEVDLPRRQDVVNRVDVRFDYRFHRLRERRVGLSWHMAWFSTEAEAAGFQFPTIASIQSALRGAGWSVLSEVYYPCPASVAYAGGTVKTTGEVDSMAAVLGQRHGQAVTESHAMTVTSPESIAGNGTLARDLRCTLASEWSPDTWEGDFTQAPTDAGAGLDHAPDAPRADAEAGMEVALRQAEAMIHASHRNTRVRFDLPCMPEIDLDRALTVESAMVTATGKVWSVEHVLDPGQGRAITRVTLAIAGVAAAGLATPTPTPPTPPAAPDIDAATGPDSYDQPHMVVLVAGLSAYNGGASGWIIQAPEKISVSTGQVNNPYYNAGASFPEYGFRMLTSGVPDSHRQPLDLETTSAYQVELHEDVLLLP